MMTESVGIGIGITLFLIAIGMTVWVVGSLCRITQRHINRNRDTKDINNEIRDELQKINNLGRKRQ